MRRPLDVQGSMRPARLNGMTYGEFIDGLKKSGVVVNRKLMADMAVERAGSICSICDYR